MRKYRREFTILKNHREHRGLREKRQRSVFSVCSVVDYPCVGTGWRHGINNYEVILMWRVTPQSTQRSQSLEAISNKLLRRNGISQLRSSTPGILYYRCNNYMMRFLCGGKIPGSNSAGIRIGGWDEAEGNRRLWSRQ